MLRKGRFMVVGTVHTTTRQRRKETKGEGAALDDKGAALDNETTAIETLVQLKRHLWRSSVAVDVPVAPIYHQPHSTRDVEESFTT